MKDKINEVIISYRENNLHQELVPYLKTAIEQIGLNFREITYPSDKRPLWVIEQANAECAKLWKWVMYLSDYTSWLHVINKPDINFFLENLYIGKVDTIEYTIKCDTTYLIPKEQHLDHLDVIKGYSLEEIEKFCEQDTKNLAINYSEQIKKVPQIKNILVFPQSFSDHISSHQELIKISPDIPSSPYVYPFEYGENHREEFRLHRETAQRLVHDKYAELFYNKVSECLPDKNVQLMKEFDEFSDLIWKYYREKDILEDNESLDEKKLNVNLTELNNNLMKDYSSRKPKLLNLDKRDTCMVVDHHFNLSENISISDGDWPGGRNYKYLENALVVNSYHFSMEQMTSKNQEYWESQICIPNKRNPTEIIKMFKKDLLEIMTKTQ